MKNQTKIQLSTYEMELVSNAELLLTKNAIMEKVKQVLENIQYAQQHFLNTGRINLPSEILRPLPKISKGENYKGLPYFVLDHPRYFDKENKLAIRTMFWWGNFFSITLHLSGIYKKKLEKKIIDSRNILIKNDFYVCIHSKEWEHHFEIDNYISAGKMNKPDFENLVRESSFLKLAKKISLEKWKDAEKILLSDYKQIIKLLID